MTDIDVAIDVVRHRASGDFLVLRKAQEYREASDRYGAAAWEMPGGKIAHELGDEAVEDAALRELEEETGLDGEAVRVGDPFRREVDGMTVTFHPVLVLVDSRDVDLSTEHDDAAWIGAGAVQDYGTASEDRAFDAVIDAEVDA